MKFFELQRNIEHYHSVRLQHSNADLVQFIGTFMTLISNNYRCCVTFLCEKSIEITSHSGVSLKSHKMFNWISNILSKFAITQKINFIHGNNSVHGIKRLL